MLATFQFTHPGGVRRQARASGTAWTCFNSRTREGCDSKDDKTPPEEPTFQFTHPGGVRL